MAQKLSEIQNLTATDIDDNESNIKATYSISFTIWVGFSS